MCTIVILHLFNHLPVMIFDIEGSNPNDTCIYLAMNVLNPVAIDCSMIRTKLTHNQVLLNKTLRASRGNSEKNRSHIKIIIHIPY